MRLVVVSVDFLEAEDVAAEAEHLAHHAGPAGLPIQILAIFA